MRIIVAHPDRQHSNALLRGLKDHHALTFFTSFSSKNLTLGRRLFNKYAKHLHQKRVFDLPRSQVKHLPLLLVLTKLLKLNLVQRIKFQYLIFDLWVSKQMPKQDFDIFIGYENSNLRSNKKARQLGKVVVLDLAAVHHVQNQKLWDRFPLYRDSIGDETDFAAMNKRKSIALEYTDYCFCLSSYARQTLIEGGFPAERIFVTNLGIDPSLFSVKSTYNDARDKPFKILYVGRISEMKGVFDLIQVFQSLSLPNLELRLIGPMPPGAPDLENLSPDIRYFSSKPHAELVSEYQWADVFVNFSYTDSWAQTVIEAMACGTPVIVTENTGSKDAVEQGGGFIIPVADKSALKEKLLYFYDRRTEVGRLGREAYQVAQQYTWGKYVDQVQQALESIAQLEDIEL